MKHSILYMMAFLFMAVCSCSSDDAVDAEAPVVQFPLEQLNVDLNTVDNLPIIAVIQSKAGLAQVNIDINTAEDGVIHYKTITDFYNAHNYSLAESPEYKVGYTSVTVEAIDRQGQKVTAEMPITVKGIMARPVITFNPGEIVYDEMEENPVIPRTTFTVESEAGLKSVEAILVSKDNQETLKKDEELNGVDSYAFDEMIEYKEGDKGVKVIAIDTYGNATIATLPVTYKIVPVPVVTLDAKGLSAESGKDVNFPVSVTSIRGLKYIDLFLVEGEKTTLAKRVTLSGEKEYNKSVAIKLTQATSHVQVVASDGREGKESSAMRPVFVDMRVATANIGSCPLANQGHKDYENAFGMFSLKDMRSYTVDYALESADNAKNIDFKFYRLGKDDTTVRLYSMDNQEKDVEYKGINGNLKSIAVKNQTRFKIVNDEFDYDNATLTSIKKINAGSISISKLTPFKVGDIIAFRTGSTSAAGAAKVGVMKVVNIIDGKTLGTNDATANILVVEIKMPTK